MSTRKAITRERLERPWFALTLERRLVVERMSRPIVPGSFLAGNEAREGARPSVANRVRRQEQQLHEHLVIGRELSIVIVVGVEPATHLQCPRLAVVPAFTTNVGQAA